MNKDLGFLPVDQIHGTAWKVLETVFKEKCVLSYIDFYPRVPGPQWDGGFGVDRLLCCT